LMLILLLKVKVKVKVKGIARAYALAMLLAMLEAFGAFPTLLWRQRQLLREPYPCWRSPCLSRARPFCVSSAHRTPRSNARALLAQCSKHQVSSSQGWKVWRHCQAAAHCASTPSAAVGMPHAALSSGMACRPHSLRHRAASKYQPLAGRFSCEKPKKKDFGTPVTLSGVGRQVVNLHGGIEVLTYLPPAKAAPIWARQSCCHSGQQSTRLFVLLIEPV